MFGLDRLATSCEELTVKKKPKVALLRHCPVKSLRIFQAEKFVFHLLNKTKEYLFVYRLACVCVFIANNLDRSMKGCFRNNQSNPK